jgi:hypothetical protein
VAGEDRQRHSEREDVWKGGCRSVIFTGFFATNPPEPSSVAAIYMASLSVWRGATTSFAFHKLPIDPTIEDIYFVMPMPFEKPETIPRAIVELVGRKRAW